MISSLRGRLFVGILATVLVAVAISLTIGVLLTRDAVRDSFAEQLSREADLLAGAFTATGGAGERIQFLRALPFEAGITHSPDVVPLEGPLASGQDRKAAGVPAVGADEATQLPVPAAPPEVALHADPADPGRPAPSILSLDQTRALLPQSALDSLESDGRANGRATIAGEDQLYAARTLATGSGASGGDGPEQVFMLTRSAAIGGDDFDPYLGGLLLASGLAGLLAAVAAALLARRLTAPIGRVSAASRELAGGRRPEPLPEDGPEELATLSRSFNEMTSQLEQAREAERSVLLSISHELRTPLTAIRGYAEGVEDSAVDPAEANRVIAAESARLERLVKDLLVLARLEQGVLDFRDEPIDLGQIAEDARRRLAFVAGDRGVEVSLEQNGATEAKGDPDRALQVISNLIENAIRATPNGGEVDVAVGPASVTITDTGPGIEAADVPRAFERFHLHQRAGVDAGDGSGLGLAIVRELTEGMGGAVELRSAAGEGAEFTVRFRSAGNPSTAGPP